MVDLKMQAMIEQYKSSPGFAFAEQRKPHLQEVDAAAPEEAVVVKHSGAAAKRR